MNGAPASGPSLLVVGTGLLGTSAGLAARRTGWRVWLADVDSEARTAALERGAGEALGERHVVPDVVLVAVPPRHTAAVVVDALRTYPRSTISDVASIKADVLVEVERTQDDIDRFVPGHPLAGSEGSGPAAARADLFRDRAWVLTPGPRTDPARIAQMERLATDLGAVPMRWDAAAHDRAVALTSHLPQLLSSALAAQLAAQGAADTRLSGQGLRDMTRIAASDPEMWVQILTANAGPVAEALAPLTAELQQLQEVLQGLAAGRDVQRGTRALDELLRRGRSGQARIPGKHGAAAEPTASVVVAIADRPGELARLFAVAATAGVNLEDVRIDHALGRPTGLVELVVERGSAPVLLAALRAEGWQPADS